MAFQLAPSTLGSYITAVRDMLNQPNASNSFWSDAEITRYLNEAIRIYFLEVTNNDEGFWTKAVTLNIVTNTELVALPDDCFEVKGVWKVVSNGRIPLAYRNNTSGGVITQPGGGSGGETYFPSYSFQENNLKLNPVPNYSETGGLHLEYIYFPDMLAQSGDTMSTNVLPIFKQLIEMYAVYKAKLKESLTNGTDTSALAKRNFDELYVLFRDTVRNRSKFPQFVKPWNAGYDTF
jgi:hypothetical protein